MVRRLQYYGSPDEIKDYLNNLGYKVQEHHYSDDKSKVTGFTVLGTDVRLSYDLVSRHPVTGDLTTLGFGMIGLHTNPQSLDYSPEKAARSLKLYEKLYRRFRRKY